MTGIILAGGENRRMGTDKAFLDVAGRPLVERVINVLKGLFERVIIVTNTPQAYARYAVSVVTDAIDKRGPLTGIYSGLLASKDDYNFVVACDMPFLNSGLIGHMAKEAEGYDVVVPDILGKVEPLHAVYNKRLLPLIESQIRRDSRQIQKIFETVKVRRITEEEIDRFDPERRSFINLNTPKEYEEAVCLDSECRNC
jgi:molybdopterin-guanine dinucleotide biosynthesis protein A